MKNKEIYIVTVNGKVSQEAYSDYQDAARFVISRACPELWRASQKALDQRLEETGNIGFISLEREGNLYEIADVRVAQ